MDKKLLLNMTKDSKFDDGGDERGYDQNETMKRSLHTSNFNKKIRYLNPDAKRIFT